MELVCKTNANKDDLIRPKFAVFTVFGNVLFTVIMGIPLMIIAILLGNYSKKSYLRMWQMLPLFSGTSSSKQNQQFLPSNFHFQASVGL